MHFYPFNIGDYMSHTSRLTPMEDLAYRRMIDIYYLHERPLNDCSTEIAREIGMMSNVDEIEYVLRKFFTLSDDGFYHNKRIDEEIAKYQQKVANAQKAGLASAKARAKSTSVERPLNKGSTKQETRNKKQYSKGTKVPARSKFVKPTEKEVDEYAKEKGLNLVGFYEYYESNGWKVGKNPMKNWKASASGWSKRQQHYYPTGMDPKQNAPAGASAHNSFEDNQKAEAERQLAIAQRNGFDTVEEYEDHLFKQQMATFGQGV